MIFHKVEKPPRRKTPTVDRKHPSQKSKLPRKKKPERTKLPVSPGERILNEYRSDDRRYEIVQTSSIKFKLYRCRMDTAVPIREETPINSFPTLEEAIKFAEELVHDH
jgi:hypothetical protein